MKVAPTPAGSLAPCPVASLIVLLPESDGEEVVESASSDVALLGESWQVIFAQRRDVEVDRAAGHGSAIGGTPSTLGSAMSQALGKANGRFVLFTTRDGIPSPELANTIVKDLDTRANADVVYFDEPETATSPAVVKPAHSPERLRSLNYWGAFVAYRLEIARGLFEQPLESTGAELYELALRATLAACRVENSRLQVGAPSRGIEVNWYRDETLCREGVRMALAWYLDATGGGVVDGVFVEGRHLTRRSVTGAPLVSIVIPTGGTAGVVRGESRIMVVDAVQSIIDVTTYQNIEIVIVTDASTSQSVVDGLRAIAGDRTVFVPWDGPFSFSGKMNLGVLHARGEYLILLNDDTEVISPDWVQSLLSLAQRPDAGTVGAMLYFENDTIQHAGHAYFRLDVTHIGLHSDRGSRGPENAFLVDREVDGNTAACMMVRRDRFIEVGGFSPLLPGNFNDVDLCLKLTTKGYRSYWTPRAELYHFESMTRDPRISKYEVLVAWGRWEHLLYASAYWPTDPHIVYRRDA